jgi:hypothetical protein
MIPKNLQAKGEEFVAYILTTLEEGIYKTIWGSIILSAKCGY